MRSRTIFIVLGLLCAGTAAASAAPAAEPAGEKKPEAGAVKKKAPKPTARSKRLPGEDLLVSGVVTDIADGEWTVRPWNWRLAHRLVLTRGEGCDTFVIERVSKSYAREGDLVLAAGEPDAPTPAEGQQAAPEGDEGVETGPVKPLELDGVLIFGPAPDGPISQARRQEMRAAMAAASGFFIGKRRGGAAAPTSRSTFYQGRLSLSPSMRVIGNESTHEVAPQPETLYLRVRAVDSSQIRKGQTLAAFLGQRLPKDGTPSRLTARMFFITAAPRISTNQERKLILRENRGKAGGRGRKRQSAPPMPAGAGDLSG